MSLNWRIHPLRRRYPSANETGHTFGPQFYFGRYIFDNTRTDIGIYRPCEFRHTTTELRAPAERQKPSCTRPVHVHHTRSKNHTENTIDSLLIQVTPTTGRRCATTRRTHAPTYGKAIRKIDVKWMFQIMPPENQQIAQQRLHTHTTDVRRNIPTPPQIGWRPVQDSDTQLWRELKTRRLQGLVTSVAAFLECLGLVVHVDADLTDFNLATVSHFA